MSSTIRKQDIIGRWGGEEFMILLPRTELKEAKLICERIRKKIEAKPFQNDKITVNNSMTFGVSIYDNVMNIDNCINQADEALYEGKKRGKNCVVIYNEKKDEKPK